MAGEIEHYPPIQGLGIGILMLDTGFRRYPGDVGNAATWPFPVQFRVVKGASARRVVSASREFASRWP